jgi:hypothetical protein
VFFLQFDLYINAKQKLTKKCIMEQKDLYKMTNDELLVEKKKMNNSKMFHAVFIGFLAGICYFQLFLFIGNLKSQMCIRN